MLHPNGIFALRQSGNTIKNNNEGRTTQKIPLDNATTFSTLLVSKYNQHKAKIEVKGKDAKIAAIQDIRLPISDIPAIIKADIMTFIKNCIGIPLLFMQA